MRNNYDLIGNTVKVYIHKQCERRKTTLIDLETFNILRDVDCNIYIGDQKGYAFIYFADEKRQYRLHRWIMQPSKRMTIDHINKKRRDNRKENLRIVSRAENTRLRYKEAG